jgi:hypothetical protein
MNELLSSLLLVFRAFGLAASNVGIPVKLCPTQAARFRKQRQVQHSWNQVGMAQNVRFDFLNNGKYAGTDFLFCGFIKLHSAGGWNGIPTLREIGIKGHTCHKRRCCPIANFLFGTINDLVRWAGLAT